MIIVIPLFAQIKQNLDCIEFNAPDIKLFQWRQNWLPVDRRSQGEHWVHVHPDGGEENYWA